MAVFLVVAWLMLAVLGVIAAARIEQATINKRMERFNKYRQEVSDRVELRHDMRKMSPTVGEKESST